MLRAFLHSVGLDWIGTTGYTPDRRWRKQPRQVTSPALGVPPVDLTTRQRSACPSFSTRSVRFLQEDTVLLCMMCAQTAIPCIVSCHAPAPRPRFPNAEHTLNDTFAHLPRPHPDTSAFRESLTAVMQQFQAIRACGAAPSALVVRHGSKSHLQADRTGHWQAAKAMPHPSHRHAQVNNCLTSLRYTSRNI